MTPESRRAGYWGRVRRLTAALLILWLLANLAGPWFARDLERVTGMTSWAATQVALLLYLAIIVIYCVVMNRLDRQLQGSGEADVAPGSDPA